MATRQAKPLHELLLEHGELTPKQVDQAQDKSAKVGISLKRAIIDLEFMSEQDLTSFVASQSGVTSIDLSNYLIKPEIVQIVPEVLARKYLMVPVFKIGDSLTVAMDDPLNFFAIDELRLKTNCSIKTVMASESSIRQAIDQYYGASSTMAEVAEVIEEAEERGSDEAPSEDAPVIRLVNLLIVQAVKEGASDIHIEPGDKTLRTRFRIDGILQEVKGPPFHLHSTVVSRIKVLSKLDIAEKRKAQDGRFRLKMEGKEVDLRVSSIPTQFGEKVVMRLLDSSGMILSFEKLGFNKTMSAQFEKLIRLPHGLFLVTGPTGSGKTTTLYAALNLINSVTQNILTIEDPVEYQLKGINQVQVNPKADLTFASALRSFLRQDPDVIMVGEIRDRETAEIAVQAALTGHFVLSTLHTNDAPSSLARLIEMGVEPFLLASAVIGVLAQRLVRVICPKCTEPYQPDATMVSEYKLKADAKLYRGKGCQKCKKGGYKGRVGIYELLTINDEIKKLVVSRAPAHEIRLAASTLGIKTLRDDGLEKVLNGITTMEEVVRVSQLE